MITRLTRLNAGIAGTAQQHGQPPNFEIGTRTNQQIRLAQTGDQTGTRLHMMGILQRRGRSTDVQLVATQFPCQRRPFRLAGEYLQIGTGCRIQAQHHNQQNK